MYLCCTYLHSNKIRLLIKTKNKIIAPTTKQKFESAGRMTKSMKATTKKFDIAMSSFRQKIQRTE